jgi:hypothetical protein
VRRVYQFRHWGNGGNATASIMLKAMRATPKLTYPFELRVFARAVFRLCRAADQNVAESGCAGSRHLQLRH